MTISTKNGKYFWLLNLFVIVSVLGISAKTVLSENNLSEYRLPLNEVTHYVTPGFVLEANLSDALEVTAGNNVGAGLPEDRGRTFMRPGKMPYKEFTITAAFDFTAQYDALLANTDITPGIKLPGLGDSYEIYLNGNLIASEWNVDGVKITVHKLARGTVYPINPSFFLRGENTLSFRVYGDPTTIDTGLTVTDKYIIDDFNVLNRLDYSQTVLAGICLAVALTFIVFFLLYREKKSNLWFSVTALSISLYAFFRAGAFQSIFQDYELALRLEVLSLFTFAYFITVLIYTCGNEKFNIGMKIYTGIYAVLFVSVFLPGHQFVLDVVKVFFILFVPFIIYAFVSSLCIPLVRGMKNVKREGNSALRYILNALSGTLRGNMLVGAFLPIVFAMFDQMAYVILSYQEIVLSQYGFLFFFANVTFALASDNAETHSKLVALSGEWRKLISEREFELEKKSGEVEEVKTAQMQFRETVSKEIRTPLAEIIGSIELQMLNANLTADTANWLDRLLEVQRNIHKKLDGILDDETEISGISNHEYDLELFNSHYNRYQTASRLGETRHLFVINPKSFVTLEDLKNFLLSIETCFSTGHRAEYKVYISRYPRDAYAAVHRYLSATPADETARVYAVGGDGILFDCLNGLAHFPNAELAPIPYGNANDFVRSFGADNMGLFRNIQLMSKSPPRLVDMILCGQQYALSSCSIGIEAKAVQVFSNAIERINSGKARKFVPLLYKLGAVKVLLDGSQNNMSYRIELDGADFSGNYLFISVGNIALNGGSCIPNPFAAPDDGILDLMISKSSSNINSLRMLPAYTSGQFHKFPEHLKHYRLKEMHCESDNLMSVILDGETFYTHELNLKILPKAVKIVSPNGIGFADYSQTAKGDAK